MNKLQIFVDHKNLNCCWSIDTHGKKLNHYNDSITGFLHLAIITMHILEDNFLDERALQLQCVLHQKPVYHTCLYQMNQNLHRLRPYFCYGLWPENITTHMHSERFCYIVHQKNSYCYRAFL